MELGSGPSGIDIFNPIGSLLKPTIILASGVIILYVHHWIKQGNNYAYLYGGLLIIGLAVIYTALHNCLGFVLTNSACMILFIMTGIYTYTQISTRPGRAVIIVAILLKLLVIIPNLDLYNIAWHFIELKCLFPDFIVYMNNLQGGPSGLPGYNSGGTGGASGGGQPGPPGGGPGSSSVQAVGAHSTQGNGRNEVDLDDLLQERYRDMDLANRLKDQLAYNEAHNLAGKKRIYVGQQPSNFSQEEVDHLNRVSAAYHRDYYYKSTVHFNTDNFRTALETGLLGQA